MWWKKNQKVHQRVTLPEHVKKSYHREACGVLLTSLFMFLLLAIFSYCPTDNSVFYFASDKRLVANWCGAVGSSMAAWFLYFVGSAVYLLLICIMVSAYRLLLARERQGSWVRFLLIPLLVGLGAGLCAMYGFDITKSFPGGLVGEQLNKICFSLFGVVGTALILWSLLWVSMMIIMQFSITQGIVWLVPHCYAGLRWCVLHMISGAAWVACALVRMAKQVVHGIQKPFRRLPSATMPEMQLAEAMQATFTPARPEEHPSGNVSQEEAAFWETISSCNALVTCAVQQELQPQEEAVVNEGEQKQEDVHGYDHWLNIIMRFEGKKITKTNSALTTNMFATQQGADSSPFLNIMQAAEQHKVNADRVPSEFILPNSSLFAQKHDSEQRTKVYDDAVLRGKKLEEKLHHFGIKGRVTGVKPGPLITMFEYEPEIDSKISKITSLEDDLAMALSAVSIRIIAPIPGKNMVGFEIANKTREDVLFSTVISSPVFHEKKVHLPLVLGVDVVGNPVVEDLTKMPHLLVGGATGSGKSVGLNGMLASLLCACTPDQLRLILIDPKRLEFTPYADIAHLLFPIVTNPMLATSVLKWVVQEMEKRYETMASIGVRNMLDYQKLVAQGDVDQAGNKLEAMPFIVVIIDELADLMIVAGKEVETQIVRIAQMARAAGIHMIVATQRPSVDVVTGLIKVNFPSRVAFRVSSKVDSRTILDQSGAEKLLGRGDLLFMHSASSHLMRIHGAYIADQEISKLADHVRSQSPAQYLDLRDVLSIGAHQKKGEPEDDLYPQIVSFIKTAEEISISMLQRQYRIGFNRSARIIEQLEMDGLIAPAQGSKPRKVLR